MLNTIPSGLRRVPAWAAAFALLVTAGLFLIAAPTTADAAPKAPPGGAWVRTGHFVPGMDKAQVVITSTDPRADAEPVEDLAYGTVSDYQNLEPGQYTASISSMAADPDAEPLLTSTFEVASGDARTVAVVGTADAPRVTLLTDDLTPPDADTGRVRILSASDQVDAVTVRALMGPTVAEGAVLGQATPYKSVPAGPWTLALTSSMSQDARQQVEIASGSVYTVVVVDAAGGGVELNVLTDAAGAAVAPEGGAETGLGGAAATTADTSNGTATVLLAGLVLAGAAGLGIGARRRVKVAGARS